MGEKEIDIIREINSLNLNAELLTWNRLSKVDVDRSLETGVSNIHISAPTSDIHIYGKLRKDRKWIMDQLRDVVSYAIRLTSYNVCYTKLLRCF